MKNTPEKQQQKSMSTHWHKQIHTTHSALRKWGKNGIKVRWLNENIKKFCLGICWCFLLGCGCVCIRRINPQKKSDIHT